jgi:diaminopimelate decarboxylase
VPPTEPPLSFLSDAQAHAIQREFGTPVFVYDQGTLEAQADAVLSAPNAFGLTARYAMKACPTAAVVRVLVGRGLHVDASSGYEVERARAAGVAAERIQLTAQQLPDDLASLVAAGVLFNACSLAQIDAFGRACPGRALSIRLNPGLGSGHSNRTNVGGPSSSFGIWHEHLGDALALARKHGLTVAGVHTHIGSGSDPAVWQRVALLSLDMCARVPDATRLNLGGGFKVGRVAGEETADLAQVGAPIAEAFRAFAARHGRALRLEIEPGTYLVANAGALVASVIDVVDTGREGYRFVKLDAGMTEILRPSMYGAQHPIRIVPVGREESGEDDYLVVGHCCESGDVLTPARGDPEALAPRRLRTARIGDAVVIGGAGAYCSGMAAVHYNSFPAAPEVMIARDGRVTLVRKRGTLAQVTQNEVGGLVF